MRSKKILILGAMILLTGIGFLGCRKVFAAAPSLKEGSYLSGQSLSVWPSWSVLGNTVGQVLPVDPINQLGVAGTCISSTNIFCTSDSGCPLTGGNGSLAWWRFDSADKNGTMIADKSGNGNNGQMIAGAAIIPGGAPGFAQALQLDGDSGYVTTNALTFSDYFSADFWIKPNIQSPNWQGILTEDNYGSGTGWYMYLSNGSTARELNFTYARAGHAGVDIPDAFALGVWSHVVVENNAGSVTVYIDGILKINNGRVDINNAGNALNIGARHNDNGSGVKDYFSGTIDEVHIYDKSPANRSGAREACVLHDTITGWSTADRRFSFACASTSYAYRYIAPLTTSSPYQVRAHFENPFDSHDIGQVINNWPQFVGTFVSTSIVSIALPGGICNGDQEISTINRGTCGDGMVNLNQGEQCDPPGSAYYDKTSCTNPSANVNIKTCDQNCQWTYSTAPCSSLGKCGNGIVEAGEVCDDGRLNGRYNHCNSDCHGWGGAGSCGDGILTPANEVCDTALQTRYCVGGRNNGNACTSDSDCPANLSTGAHYCGSVSQLYQALPNGSVWSLYRNHSCNWDCQSYGPYCGDHIVQQLTDQIPGPLGNPISISGGSGYFSVLSSLGHAVSVKEQNTTSSCEGDDAAGRVSCSVNSWDYTVNLAAGSYSVQTITSNANQDLSDVSLTGDAFCPAPGIQHHITLKLDGVSLGSYCADAVPTPQNGQIYYFNIPSGPHTITLVWDNDWTLTDSSGVMTNDSNIRINNIKINSLEQCDGNQSCTLNGQPGTQYCDSSCQVIFSPPDYSQDPVQNGLVGWWTLDSITGNILTDRTGHSLDGKLMGGVTAVDGKIYQALKFNGTDGYVFTPASVNIPSGHSPRTITAWIKGFTTPTNALRTIIGYGTNQNGNFGHLFYFSVGTNNNIVLWGNTYNAIGSVHIDPSVWTNVAVTYDGATTILYVNGSLDTRATPNLDTTAGTSINFGRPPPDNPIYNSYDGQLDDVRLYNRTLSASEIATISQGLQGNACTLSAQVAVTTTIPGTCGDGVVDTNEVCDKGLANNGKPCTPSYNKACSYCSADCKNVISVAPTQYCGDGIVQGPEICDTDPITKNIYVSLSYYANHQNECADATLDHGGCADLSCESEPQNDHTYKKGTKVCANNCTALQLNTGESSCILCGLASEADGIKVEGSIVDVTHPITPMPADTAITNLRLFIQEPEFLLGFYDNKIFGQMNGNPTIADSYSLMELGTSPGTTSGHAAYINYNPICSSGDAHYKMMINDDTHHDIDMPVVWDDSKRPTKPWQYDMVLSPVIDQALAPDMIRIVVSWTGTQSDFRAGFFLPAVTGYFNGGLWETMPGIYPSGGGINPSIPQNQQPPYMDIVDSYGATTTPTETNVESFAIPDLYKMNAVFYPFYVRNVAGTSIAAGVSANLKVEIYFPESDNTQGHFGRPTKTYYLSQAIGTSNNPGASFWQVFNVIRPVSGGITTGNVLDTDTLVTDPQHFVYAASCAGQPLGTVCRITAGYCDQPETCDGSSSDCPSDTFMPSGTVCVTPAGVCDNGSVCNGFAANCPVSTLKPSGTVCRAVAGNCDIAETCNGSSSDCGTDHVKAAGTACTIESMHGIIAGDAGKCNGTIHNCLYTCLHNGNSCVARRSEIGSAYDIHGTCTNGYCI